MVKIVEDDEKSLGFKSHGFFGILNSAVRFLVPETQLNQPSSPPPSGSIFS